MLQRVRRFRWCSSGPSSRPTANPSKKTTRLLLEPLEDRTAPALLAATPFAPQVLPGSQPAGAARVANLSSLAGDRSLAGATVGLFGENTGSAPTVGAPVVPVAFTDSKLSGRNLQAPVNPEGSVPHDATTPLLLVGGGGATGSQAPLSGLGDDRRITITTAADVARTRQALINFIWGAPGIPTGKLPTVIKNDLSPVSNLTNLERVDTLIINMEAGQTSYAHHFIPQRKNNRLVILHNGHDSTFDDSSALADVGAGMQRTINGLLMDGYSVLAVYMPHIVQFHTRLSVNDVGSISHDDMFNRIHVQQGSVMKFFLEPVAVSLNYLKTRSAADGFPVYQDFSMIGLSGGGWTTTVYAAIDPTIKFSFPVAGSIPLYSVGDTEQTLPSFYRIAGYLDLYVLGSYGSGRKQVQILNRREGYPFGEAEYNAVAHVGMSYDDALRDYEYRVRVALSNLEPGGFFRLEIDEAAPSHMISWNALVNTILAELNGGRSFIGAASSTDAFVRGQNGHLWHNGPGGWQDTSFAMVGVPAVVQGAVNQIDVFYRNPRNEPMHAFWNGATWRQEPIYGTIITDPAAISTAPGRIDIVAFGRSYRLYHWRLTGTGASPYQLVEGSPPGLGTPVLVSRGPRQLDIFYRGFDRGLYHVQSTGDPAPWRSECLGGTMLDFPTAVALPDGSLRAYVRDQSSRLFEAAQLHKDAPWLWTPISDQTGGQLVAGSPSASVQDGVVSVHARTRTGSLATFVRSRRWRFVNHGGLITGSPTAVPGGTFARSASGGLLLDDGANWFSWGGIFD
jgi:hypothetical protein